MTGANTLDKWQCSAGVVTRNNEQKCLGVYLPRVRMATHFESDHSCREHAAAHVNGDEPCPSSLWTASIEMNGSESDKGLKFNGVFSQRRQCA